MKKMMLIIIACIGFTYMAMAQKVAVKTNLLYDATTTLNLGAEFGLSPKWTLDVSGNYNPWTFKDNKKIKHWQVQPEARYWFCNKMMGHFVGFHALGGQYNIGGKIPLLSAVYPEMKEHRYEGFMVGAGIAYGYAWTLAKHWNLEGEIGLGYVYSHYKQFKCEKCGEKEGSGDHHYVGPTKAALNLVYVF